MLDSCGVGGGASIDDDDDGDVPDEDRPVAEGDDPAPPPPPAASGDAAPPALPGRGNSERAATAVLEVDELRLAMEGDRPPTDTTGGGSVNTSSW